MCSLKLDKQFEDVRGKIFFFSHGNTGINLIEIKKGFARGGHYHKYDQVHIIISGKIEIRQENIETGNEEVKIITSPETIRIPQNTAHLFTALVDSSFLEIFDYQYEATTYPKYRKIVEERMNT